MGERTLCVSIAQCRLSHVRQLDRALRRRVHEQVARLRVELGGRDDLRELLHVRWLDVDDVCGREQEPIEVEMSVQIESTRKLQDVLKQASEMLRFQRLILRSSALM